MRQGGRRVGAEPCVEVVRLKGGCCSLWTAEKSLVGKYREAFGLDEGIACRAVVVI